MLGYILHKMGLHDFNIENQMSTLSDEELNALRIESETSLYNSRDRLDSELLQNEINDIMEVLEDYQAALKFDNIIMNYYEKRCGEV